MDSSKFSDGWSALLLLFMTCTACSRVKEKNAEPDVDRAKVAPASAPLAIKPARAESLDACSACERAKCSKEASQCFDAKDSAESGPATGKSRAELCSSVLSCVRTQHCAKAEISACYCGADIEPPDCVAPKAKKAGPCVSEIEAGAETTDALTVGTKYVDTDNATGRAFTLVRCYQDHCRNECL